MSSRISITLLICLIGAWIAVGALFLPPREAAEPYQPAAPTESAPTEAGSDPTTGDPTTGAPAGRSVEVSIEAFTFTSVGALAAGQEVVVTNNDSVPHTLTANDGSFDTGFLNPGEQALITVPNESGKFSFFCEVHPSMTGVFDVST